MQDWGQVRLAEVRLTESGWRDRPPADPPQLSQDLGRPCHETQAGDGDDAVEGPVGKGKRIRHSADGDVRSLTAG